MLTREDDVRWAHRAVGEVHADQLRTRLRSVADDAETYCEHPAVEMPAEEFLLHERGVFGTVNARLPGLRQESHQVLLYQRIHGSLFGRAPPTVGRWQRPQRIPGRTLVVQRWSRGPMHSPLVRCNRLPCDEDRSPHLSYYQEFSGKVAYSSRPKWQLELRYFSTAGGAQRQSFPAGRDRHVTLTLPDIFCNVGSDTNAHHFSSIPCFSFF